MLPEVAASPLRLLLGAAGIVLFVACANVAGLLLARSGEREREMALRAALGASRGRLIRLLLAEAAILGVGATVVALLVSAVATRLAVPLLAQWGNAVTLDVSLDWRVLTFAAAMGALATAACGLAPIVATLRRRLGLSLADGGRSASGGRRRALMRRGLVTTQFALSLALLVVATLLVRTLHNLRTLPTGFDLDHLAVLEVDASAAQYNPSQAHPRISTRAAARLAAMPGVTRGRLCARAAARFRWLANVGRDSRAIRRPPTKTWRSTSIACHRAISTRWALRAIDGRLFDATDVRGALPAVIVNETMARRYWKTDRAVGRLLRLGPGRAAHRRRRRPGCEVPDAARRGRAVVLPADRAGHGPAPARSTCAPTARQRSLLDTLRRTLGQVDAAVPVTRARTLREQADLNVTDERLAMTIALALAAAAVLLAAVGLYATIAHGVAQRRREIGVRLALGAVPRDVRRLVLAQGLAMALVGSVAGAGLGLLFAQDDPR